MSATNPEPRDSQDLPWSHKILAECIGEEPPPCQAACPLDIRVREKLRLLREGRTADALAVVLERCPFPGILGRICLHPCETACTRRDLGGPLAIAALKRCLADLDPEAAHRLSQPGPERPERVAVVGGGPAGLMAAYDLRRQGYPVTIFEAADTLGGALYLYIPAYRLPREVLAREVSLVERLGAEVRLRTRLGRDIYLEDLRRDFAAVFLALGTHRSLRLEVAGEDLTGVVDGIGLLRSLNTGEHLAPGCRVVVIGGGNVALDAARSCLRHGASQVTLVYRKSPEEMPAAPHEVAEARREGLVFLHGWIVKRILGEAGRVRGLELRPSDRVLDDPGRFPATFREDHLQCLEADLVVTAIGQTADFNFFGPGLAFDTRTTYRLEVDPVTLKTRIPGVFAGGDLVTGPRTALEAFAAGRRAALSIHCELQQEPLPEILPPLGSRPTRLVVDTAGVAPAPRPEQPGLTIPERLARPDVEAEAGLTTTAAQEEAGRCLSCACSHCVSHCTFLQAQVQHYPHTPRELLRTMEEAEARLPYSCHLCGLCEMVCPQGLDIGQACLERRRQMVAQGQGPLRPHRGIQNYVRWGTSPLLTLNRPDPATGRAQRVFFPGCALAGYSPHLVRRVYEHLRVRLPHTGIMLNCCGAPSHLLGEDQRREEVLEGVAAGLASLEAEELILACTHCQETIAAHRPGLRTRSLYEVLLEIGLPEERPEGPQALFNIHDACGARHLPEVQTAVRRLVQQAGHGYEEMPHHRERTLCCGAGGMVPAVDAPLAQKMTDLRLAEARHDLLTYCATCRARFAGSGRPSLHLLELLFNPQWPRTRHSSPAGSTARWWRRWRLKRQLQSL